MKNFIKIVFFFAFALCFFSAEAQTISPSDIRSDKSGKIMVSERIPSIISTPAKPRKDTVRYVEKDFGTEVKNRIKLKNGLSKSNDSLLLGGSLTKNTELNGSKQFGIDFKNVRSFNLNIVDSLGLGTASTVIKGGQFLSVPFSIATIKKDSSTVYGRLLVDADGNSSLSNTRNAKSAGFFVQSENDAEVKNNTYSLGVRGTGIYGTGIAAKTSETNVLYIDTNGKIAQGTIPTTTPTPINVKNGLSKNTAGDSLVLGGALTKTTTITTSVGNDLQISGTGNVQIGATGNGSFVSIGAPTVAFQNSTGFTANTPSFIVTKTDTFSGSGVRFTGLTGLPNYGGLAYFVGNKPDGTLVRLAAPSGGSGINYSVIDGCVIKATAAGVLFTRVGGTCKFTIPAGVELLSFDLSSTAAQHPGTTQTIDFEWLGTRVYNQLSTMLDVHAPITKVFTTANIPAQERTGVPFTVANNGVGKLRIYNSLWTVPGVGANQGIPATHSSLIKGTF